MNTISITKGNTQPLTLCDYSLGEPLNYLKDLADRLLANGYIHIQYLSKEIKQGLKHQSIYFLEPNMVTSPAQLMIHFS